MGTEIIHNFIPRAVAVLTFCIGLAVSIVISNFIPPPAHNPRLAAILTPARERNMKFSPNEQPFDSTDFLIVQQSNLVSSLVSNCSLMAAEPRSDLNGRRCVN
jgi:hypothetical protein